MWRCVIYVVRTWSQPPVYKVNHCNVFNLRSKLFCSKSKISCRTKFSMGNVSLPRRFLYLCIIVLNMYLSRDLFGVWFSCFLDCDQMHIHYCDLLDSNGPWYRSVTNKADIDYKHSTCIILTESYWVSGLIKCQSFSLICIIA